ncbi:MAG: DsrE family protein [Pseudomonadota bacterium]
MTDLNPGALAATERTGPAIWIQQHPSAGLRAQAGVDTALSFAVFEQSPTVVFANAGVCCLSVPMAAPAGLKSLLKLIDSFPLYDIEQIFIDGRSLKKYSLDADQLPEFAVVQSPGELSTLVHSHPAILSF